MLSNSDLNIAAIESIMITLIGNGVVLEFAMDVSDLDITSSSWCASCILCTKTLSQGFSLGIELEDWNEVESWWRRRSGKGNSVWR